ncbi:MAG: hypothetical protein V3V08_05650 [Nannocystaceae bacterium]
MHVDDKGLRHISEVIGPVMDDLEKRIANPTQMPNLVPVTRDEWDITRCVECGELGWTCECSGPKEAA